MPDKISKQSQDESLAIANSTQKPGQTKAQTKLIAAGIEKGIAVYKKQHKAKMRTQDKQRKKSQRAQESSNVDNLNTMDETKAATTSSSAKLPWALLVLSWLGFITYITLFLL